MKGENVLREVNNILITQGITSQKTIIALVNSVELPIHLFLVYFTTMFRLHWLHCVEL